MSQQYLYKVVPNRLEMLAGGLTEDENRLVGEHFQYLVQLSEKGVCLLAGRTSTNDQSTFGIVILTTDSDENANQIMRNDPAVKHGVFAGEIFPFKIATGSLAPKT